jgi:hypothetical protein
MQQTIGLLGAVALSLAVGCGGGGGAQQQPVASVKYGAVGSYPITECLKDNASGLMWEGKAGSGLRAGGLTYTNYDSTAVPQVLANAAYATATQAQLDATTNAVGYKKAVNALALCGYTDWRLPSRDELKGLVEPKASPTGANIDGLWFSNTPAYVYWTASPYETNASYAWLVDFFDGSTAVSFDRGTGAHIRLVR